MSEATDKLVALAASQVGGAYVFGAWGDLCTPAHRKARARLVSKARAKTICADCPVLAGKQSTCAGCQHEGKIEADCRGFTDWLLRTAGVIDLYGDTVPTQYNTVSNWSGGGTVDALPDKPCILFRRDALGRYGHTGLYDGAGYAIHAAGPKVGIVREPVSKTGFTHWKYPRGLYSDTGGGEDLNTIRKGSAGEDVTALQTMLARLGYDCGTVDGIFGVKTVAAVRAYQAKKGLMQDGVCGPLTWGAITVDIAQMDAGGEQNGEDKPDKDAVQDASATEVAPVTRAEFDALAVMVNTMRAELDALAVMVNTMRAELDALEGAAE